MDLEKVINDPVRSRYEMRLDGGIVFARYDRHGNILRILHVEAPPALRGTGAAGRFMKAMMEAIRSEGLKAAPVCSYAVAWLARHPEYQDLMA